ncbi:hypothetical protein DL767_008963 [Monosporascus sp. MG133]|nr:hypothetical protein DL767_008963 [Monosporascus sp. MG133]
MGYRRKRPKTVVETIRSLDIERVLEVAKTILLKLRSLASSDNATLKAGLAVLTLLFGPTWPILLIQRIFGISVTAPTGGKGNPRARANLEPGLMNGVRIRRRSLASNTRGIGAVRKHLRVLPAIGDDSNARPASYIRRVAPMTSIAADEAEMVVADRLAGTGSERPPSTSIHFKFYSETLSKLHDRWSTNDSARNPLAIQIEQPALASILPPGGTESLTDENTAIQGFYSYKLRHGNNSLDLAASRMLPNVSRSNSKQKPKARPNIPRSRTLNVFSNITNSLSRSSLASFTRNDSRHPSTSTTATTSTGGTADSSTTESRFGMSISTSSIRAVAGNTSPGKIRTAQPSAYWTGRFVALHDKFRSEILLPENLPMAISAQAERAPSKATTTGLPAAATTGSIPPPRQPLKTSSSSGNAFAHYLETTATTASNKRKHKQTASSSTTKSTVTATTTATTPRKSKPGTGTYGRDDDEEEETLPLMMHDEHRRSRRAFQHLEALCTTGEARRSLHAWQQTYARRVDCEALLPRGGSMEDHRAGSGWVGRLLGNGGVGVGVGGKRTSMPSVAVGGVAGGGGVNGGPRGYGGKRGSFAL